MKKKIEWEELDFNPIKDGYWPTAENIKKRIKERRKERTKNAVIIWSTIDFNFLFLILVIWLML